LPQSLLEHRIGLYIHSVAVEVLGLVDGGEDAFQEEVVTVGHPCIGQREFSILLAEWLGGIVASI